MTRPSAVIFDIGQVLIEWDPERFYDRAIGRRARKALFAEVDLYGANRAIDRGAPFRATITALADRHPEHAAAIWMWHDRWIEMASPEIPHSVGLLHALRARSVPVFALTNFGIDTFHLAETAYPFLAAFDRRYISGELRLIKPEPAIYAHVEADCGLAPGTLLFTDDRPDSVAAAAARGWRTHLFDGPAGWAARLVAEGVLTPAEAAAPTGRAA
ncbi:MAG: HAD family phosphatase [Rhodobacteraceae bacterium]|jgi:2-haloacid dehalogenase|nr:HAD family phosphatase [Paracoccaceae bacterium]MBL4556990.1 HAD family phosphatase [Paracoccaceae bacterium]HBG98025.1 haloacid dehalogenase [Paracoccaceae bacterium]